MEGDGTPVSQKEAEDALNPVGFEFWIGQVLMVAGVVVGIWLSARAGFQEAARFTQAQDIRLARNTLRVVAKEFERNIEQIRACRSDVENNVPSKIRIHTLQHEKATGKSFMTAVDPRVLDEIDRLYLDAQGDLIPEFQHGAVEARDKKRVFAKIDHLIERAEKTIRPLLQTQEAALNAAEARLKGGS